MPRRKKSKSRRSATKERFGGRYTFDDRYLQRSHAPTGRPRLILGDDTGTGERILLKEWLRDASRDDSELQEVWRHEIRQLHRLAGYPSAPDYIVSLLESGVDDEAFYLVLSPGQRIPLQNLLERPHIPPWLAQPKPDRNRLIIWRNMLRVARGLDILHSQGLLHRALVESAIFTDGGDDPDFQLSGFEWAIRLATLTGQNEPRRTSQPAAADPIIYSFHHDWQAFGRMCEKLLKVDTPTVVHRGQRVRPSSSDAHLVSAEKHLLALFSSPVPQEPVHGEEIIRRIDGIISGLEMQAAKREIKLYLACQLGRNSSLSSAIRDASDVPIEVSDTAAQLKFIEMDLEAEPLLVAVSDHEGASAEQFRLIGRRLTYRIRAFAPRNRNTSTWEIAYCDRSMPRPFFKTIRGENKLSDISIEVMSSHEAQQRLRLLTGKAAQWDKQIKEPDGADLHSPAKERIYRSLLLVQLLEALLRASEVWPVEVVDFEQTEEGSTIRVKPRDSVEHTRLSKALQLEPPAIRMRRLFSEDKLRVDGDWKFSESATLGEPDRNGATWRFVDVRDQTDEEPLFEFEGGDPPPLHDQLFLRESESAGNDRLLWRRAKALRALRDHSELLGMLADPRGNIRSTHDTLTDDGNLSALDTSKREALREIWSVLPVYLLQGPPGVGKTRLVRELADKIFAGSDLPKLLMTAQSHQAVDHLMNEISEIVVDTTPQTLVVRTRPRDRDDMPSAFDLNTQTEAIIERFSSSELATKLSPMLRAKLDQLRTGTQHEDGNDSKQPPARGARRALEGLILRSANIVFASTNSGSLERLIEEGTQFDWSIVEEAGKASGVELVPPLLLSYRRLLIGDHKQLPPFNADLFLRLFSNPQGIRDAFEAGRPLVSRVFRDTGLDETFDSLDKDDDLSDACENASAALMMFETLVERELTLSSPDDGRNKIARRLNHQHRMHPAICRIVSDTFYEGDLQTDKDRKLWFETRPPPFQVFDPKQLPLAPIVFVNMPYIQTEMGKRTAERLPRYHNPDEVDTVVNVLSLILPPRESANPTTLAVLSPYRQQMIKLRERISDEETSRLSHLRSFKRVGQNNELVGTVDSFQGTEADIVIVSLVRNNHHTGARGLGFLADARRMNVLLSRAKWKLILIGSLDFLKARVPDMNAIEEGHTLAFLKKFLSTLDALQFEKDACGIEGAVVINPPNGSPR